jgi:hypothetical protein
MLVRPTYVICFADDFLEDATYDITGRELLGDGGKAVVYDAVEIEEDDIVVLWFVLYDVGVLFYDGGEETDDSH